MDKYCELKENCLMVYVPKELDLGESAKNEQIS